MNCKYPNLAELTKYHPYSICTCADHAGVTVGIYEQVLNGREELSVGEAINLAALYEIPFRILASEELVMLDNSDKDPLYHDAIEDLQKRAHNYRSPSTRAAVENLVTDFAEGRASYCQYIAAEYRVSCEELHARVETAKAAKRSARFSA